MNIRKWLDNNTATLENKTVAITGSTGGLGRETCKYLAGLGANLILLDRNASLSNEHKEYLLSLNSAISVECINIDLEDIDSVIDATEILKERGIDVFVHNAGAYSIPRRKCKNGYDNVFQINFVSPYYMIKELLPQLSLRNGKVVAVGSIAHNYSRVDKNDVDFSQRKASSKVYGNAKRYLMFSLYELFRSPKDVSLSVTHPGITFTNITAHYPKLIFAIIKHPMKVIFMPSRKAALCIIKGVFDACGYSEWIGPRVFDVWGLPLKRRLKTCKKDESAFISQFAEESYKQMKRC